MATLVFQAAGAALGSVFGPVGAILGRAAGALAGNAVDRALLSGRSTTSGPRLAMARIPGADEGTAVSRVYGTARIAGTLIWATRFEEEARAERSGGKGGGARIETFHYFANVAIGLCEGSIAGVRRVWADGRELDLTTVEMRVHTGGEAQLPDPLIEARQGAGKAPAYRGLAYVVLERLPLDPYGNRLPLLQFEVMRPVGRLEAQIRAVTIIPGATEHGYAAVPVSERVGEGASRILNRHVLTGATDWQASLDELQALCPGLERVALVVSWFGTDLRAGHCRILPGVEVAERADESLAWSVAGMVRSEAHRVSAAGDGSPAFGGTPSDAGMKQAIADLKKRGLEVYLYPFLMMDIAPGNGLPDPYGGAEQPAFPWRGRITCHPAPGRPQSPDGSAAIADDVAAFTSAPEGYRRMILHYAALAEEAGGVDGFVIGSELRGVTQLRDDAGAFPFVGELLRLAGDVRAVLGPETKLTYGADWSEYFGHHPQDGSGDVFFHLDPLWASDDIDAVGIDNYMPLADWRDGDLAASNPDGFRLAEDEAAMAGQINAGEGFDWYYVSDDDRRARIRTPITDGLAGKPWVFRYKDIENWWSNRHHDRVGGVESTLPTAWTPRMKPIWFTELGCPALDKGANRPNVFLDPKSAESAMPWFSAGVRSDAMQRRFLEAHHGWWQGDKAPAGMVDPGHVFVWTWDARPFPAFPSDLSAWSDGPNWRTGHWLNGRLGAATLADTLAAILADHGFADFDVSEVGGDLTGYVQSDIASARTMIEPLLDLFSVDAAEDGAVLRFRSRRLVSLPPAPVAVVADVEDEPLWSESRGHDSDFAAEVVLTSADPLKDYEPAGSRSRQADTVGRRLLRYELPAVLAREAALGSVESLLRGERIARRRLSFSLPPADIALRPGDALRLDLPGYPGPQGTFIVERVEEGALRRIEAIAHAPEIPVDRSGGEPARTGGGAASLGFSPLLHFLDLPRFGAGDAASFARVAALCRPFRRMALSSSSGSDGYAPRVTLERPARLGRLVSALAPGPPGRFDRANAVELDLFFGGLSSSGRMALLEGANLLAVAADDTGWELLGFADAEEVAPDRWRLSQLLRGLAGSEDAMAAGHAAGAAVVLIDDAVRPLGLLGGERGRELNWLVEAMNAAGSRSGPHRFAGGIRAETPLAPVHVRGERLASGDIRFTWVRRGRVDADDWEAADIPLDEPEERYRVEILRAGTVRRRIEVTEPRLIYAAADEIADFGTPQARLSLAIRQMGRAVPLGMAAATEIIFA